MIGLALSARARSRWWLWLGVLMVATIAGLVLAVVVARKRDAARAQAAAQSNDWKDILVAQAERARFAPRLALPTSVRAPSEPAKQATWKDLPPCPSVKVSNVQSTGDGKVRGVWMSDDQGSPALVLLGARYGEFLLESVGQYGGRGTHSFAPRVVPVGRKLAWGSACRWPSTRRLQPSNRRPTLESSLPWSAIFICCASFRGMSSACRLIHLPPSPVSD